MRPSLHDAASRRAGALAKGGAGAAVLPTGSLKSLTIRDATPIDPQASIGANGSGWVAEAVLKGLTDTGGAADPTKLLLVVSDPGFDASGNPTTVTRMVLGVAHVRRQYPNGNSKLVSTDGTDLTVLVSLSDWIYAGTTLLSASIGNGFYPSAVASAAGRRTNNSVTAYPRPVFGWMNVQQESAGASKDVEAVAFHRHGMNGRQVACIKFTASDGTHSGATSTVNDTAFSSIQTSGNIAEVYKATVDTSTMTQGGIFTVNAVVYPWLGDTPFDLAANGYAWPTSLPATPLRLLADHSGGYGGAFAYVSPSGNDGTGVVSATAATARANPYATIAAATAALKSWNNTNKGHNDLGGATLRLMDNAGSPQTWDVASSGWGTTTAGLTWFTVEADPAATAAVTFTNSGFAQSGSLIRFHALTMGNGSYVPIGPGSTPASSTSNDRTLVAFDACTFSGSGNPTWYNLYWYRNCIFTSNTDLNSLSGNYDGIASVIGGSVNNSNHDLGSIQNVNMVIGVSGHIGSGYNSNTTIADGALQRIYYNSQLGMALQNTSARTLADLVVAQNLFDLDNTNGNVTACNIFADGDLTTITNVIEIHNTVVGDRGSHFYNDSAATQVAPSGIQKVGVSTYNIWTNYNIKGDTFTSGQGSVGGWAMMFQVGNHGNVCLFGAVGESSTDAPHNDNADVPYLGMAWQADSDFNLQQHGLTKAQIMALFTNWLNEPHASPAMGGNYQPVHGASYITAKVPLGASILKYDIAGNVRKTDGTGAAGAYEAA